MIVGMAALRDFSGATRLIWLPTGVTVAILHLTPRHRWPEMVLALLAGHFTGRGINGGDWIQAAGLALANTAGALLAAFIGTGVLQRRNPSGSRFVPLAGLIAAAGMGALACTAFAALVGDPYGQFSHVTWFLSNALGILVVVPLFLILHGPGAVTSERLRGAFLYRGLPWAALAMFVTGVLVLSLLPAALLFLLVVPLTIAVIRCGPVAASVGVLAYGAAHRVTAFGSGTAPALADLLPNVAVLIMQLALLLMLLTALPLSALLRTRDVLQAQLSRQNVELSESLKLLTLAEQLTGIGRWRMDLVTGHQYWSPTMLEMHGQDPRQEPSAEAMVAVLTDGGEAFRARMRENRETREPYSIDYTIRGTDGAERTMRIAISNEFDEQGRRVAVFGAVMDITMQVQRERALNAARQHALDLAAEAHKLALTDPLTHLPNRRAIFDQLHRLAQTGLAQGQPLTVVMFDIDHFKRVNDTYGHQTGDLVLRRIADLARGQIRRADLVGRIGGEEFVWLLPGVHADRARELAERLRELIERESAQGGLPRVTISVGLALLRLGDTPEQLVARADRALYRAKESGRNCVRRAA
jgi:diguanylate cyclase (GGDEF)-like protein/PAS domain S-box-containing protein